MCWVRHRPPVLIVSWWGSLQRVNYTWRRLAIGDRHETIPDRLNPRGTTEWSVPPRELPSKCLQSGPGNVPWLTWQGHLHIGAVDCNDRTAIRSWYYRAVSLLTQRRWGLLDPNSFSASEYILQYVIGYDVPWRMAFYGTLRRVALVSTDVSEEFIASIIRIRIGQLGTTLAVTS
jgi:hypothetical protein